MIPRVKSSSKICGTPAASTSEPKIWSRVSNRLIVSSASYAELNQAKLSQAQNTAKNETPNQMSPCNGWPPAISCSSVRAAWAIATT